MKQYICDCCKQPMFYEDINLKNLNWGGPIDSDTPDKQGSFVPGYAHGHKLAIKARVEAYADESRYTPLGQELKDICAACRWIALLKVAPTTFLGQVAGSRCGEIPGWQRLPEDASPERDDPAPVD